MDRGLLSELEIVMLSIGYSNEIRQEMKQADYQTEIDFIVENQKRNEFLIELALTQKTNTLLLFNYVEKHGEILFKMAQEKSEEMKKKVFFISGNTGVDEREKIRQTMERENDVVLFASFGTLAVRCQHQESRLSNIFSSL